jgi:hypothetical protein
MPLDEAQKTKVVRHRKFLSTADIREVLDVVYRSDLAAYTSNYNEDQDERGIPVHTTTYLQTRGLFHKRLSWLQHRIRQLVKSTCAQQGWPFDLQNGGILNVRVAEYHEMRVGGSLSHIEHYDIGSIITVDIMLQTAQEGALFQTLEAPETTQEGHGNSNMKPVGGTQETPAANLKTHEFTQGDALVFVSHKYHSVTPLVRGSRKVLVVEYWHGRRRRCGHRCDKPFGICTFRD